ncbi:hypothetical protein [Chryseobacterium sp. CH21]|uniref:hypothetical protein n=1 Tax=Chryseobacterium sp. CH21 TaxID=713556 RepID=UPI00100B5C38|nr:hypothetical protein [Chryseobacterium sp. CH21]
MSLNTFCFSFINAGCIVVLWCLENGDYFPIQNFGKPYYQTFITIEGQIRDKYSQTNNSYIKGTKFQNNNK